MTEIEKSKKGKVAKNVYKFYLKNGGYILTIVTAIFYALLVFSRIAIDWYAGEWAKYKSGFSSIDIYPLVYSIFIIVIIVLIVARSFLYAAVVSNASFNIFKDVIWNLLRRPISFFDTTPSGQIMNRCTKDVDDCDYMIPVFQA